MIYEAQLSQNRSVQYARLVSDIIAKKLLPPLSAVNAAQFADSGTVTWR
jgi:hypothetical protein